MSKEIQPSNVISYDGENASFAYIAWYTAKDRLDQYGEYGEPIKLGRNLKNESHEFTLTQDPSDPNNITIDFAVRKMPQQGRMSFAAKQYRLAEGEEPVATRMREGQLEWYVPDEKELYILLRYLKASKVSESQPTARQLWKVGQQKLYEYPSRMEEKGLFGLAWDYREAQRAFYEFADEDHKGIVHRFEIHGHTTDKDHDVDLEIVYNPVFPGKRSDKEHFLFGKRVEIKVNATMVKSKAGDERLSVLLGLLEKTTAVEPQDKSRPVVEPFPDEAVLPRVIFSHNAASNEDLALNN